MRKAKIYYARMDEFWRREEKLRYLEELEHIGNVNWQQIKPNHKFSWLNEGAEDEFDDYVAIGSRTAKAASVDDGQEVVFKLFSLGVSTNRDAWVRNFNLFTLEASVKTTIEAYGQQIHTWLNRENKTLKIDGFVNYNEAQISWSSTLKNHLKRGESCEYDSGQIRESVYRPFCQQYLYFNDILNDRRGQFPSIFPTPETEQENRVIWLKIGTEIPMYALVVNHIPDLMPQGGSQCFPFYTYDEDGTNRRENITDWALAQFQTHYEDPTITKWDIFYYTYAVLHHPHYRTRYAANLKRELPRIPYAPEFRPFADAGQRLADIHVNYEDQTEYPLKHLENKDLPIDWRVEKMRLSKDKTQLKYNDFLTLTGIPPAVFDYRLGNRSALDWVIDQYRIKTDKRSGITNDPNRLDDEAYIVRLIKQVITVSLETVKIVNALPDLGLPTD